MRYAKGDEIILKVEDKFGYTTSVVRPVKVMVIGYSLDVEGSDVEYLCYVPPYQTIPNSITIGTWHVKRFGCDKKFVNDSGCYITARTENFKHIPRLPGEKCERCKEFFPYVEKELGTQWRCTACKQNPWR